MSVSSTSSFGRMAAVVDANRYKASHERDYSIFQEPTIKLHDIDSLGRTILHKCAEENDVIAMKAFVNVCSEEKLSKILEMRDKKGYTPAIAAHYSESYLPWRWKTHSYDAIEYLFSLKQQNMGQTTPTTRRRLPELAFHRAGKTFDAQLRGAVRERAEEYLLECLSEGAFDQATRCLVELNKLTHKNSAGNNALLAAIEGGIKAQKDERAILEILKTLQGMEADVNETNSSGDCLLSVAIRHRLNLIVKWLIKEVDDIDFQWESETEESLWIIADKFNNNAASEMLREKKAAREIINKGDMDGRTVLHRAADDPEKIQRYVRECGADTQVEDNYGRRPIHEAASYSHNNSGIETFVKLDRDTDLVTIAALSRNMSGAQNLATLEEQGTIKAEDLPERSSDTLVEGMANFGEHCFETLGSLPYKVVDTGVEAMGTICEVAKEAKEINDLVHDLVKVGKKQLFEAATGEKEQAPPAENLAKHHSTKRRPTKQPQVSIILKA